MSDALARLPELATAHLQLSLAALGLALLLSLPLGIAVARRPRLEGPVLGVASVLQTVPSLALLAFMVPVFAWLGRATAAAAGVELSSIGFAPALVALTLYGVLPVLRNTVTGIAEVDPALVEAARGVGMTPGQRLWRVELPLALPVIVAGVRTSTVWVVGTATLATPVGASSLGNLIFSGLQTRNTGAVVVGSVAAALLALVLDAAVRWLERGVRSRRRVEWGSALAVLAALAIWAAGSAVADRLGAPERAPVRIGTKTFTEQYVLAEVIGQHVARRTGRAVEQVQSLGSTVAFDALRLGEIDVYVDYSGTIWATIMKRSSLPAERAEVVAEVARYLETSSGVGLVAALGFENTYALAMREDQAERLGVTRISDLARHAPELEIGGDYEFFARPEWRAIVESYGLRFRDQRSMDSALMYQAAAEGDVDVISAFSTDGRIEAFSLRVLEDDHGVIPPYDAVVLVSPQLRRASPAVARALAELDGAISAARMRSMNWAVDEGGRSPADVAAAFLAERAERSGGRP